MRMTLLLGIFLASCKSIPYRPILHYGLNKCSIYCYDYNILQITDDKNCGEDFTTNERLPVTACEGVIGPHIDDYTEDIRPKVIENIEACEDQSN